MATSFSMNDIEFSHPKSNGMGGQHLFLNKKNESKFKLQTPKCGVPFGLNEYNGKFTLDLQFSGKETKQFQSNIEELDILILENASKYSFQWFKKSLHDSVLKELFRPQTKQNGNYPPLFKVKVPMKNGEFIGDVYNEKCEKVSIKELEKGCKVQVLLENTGVYFNNSSFGTGWKAVQFKVFPSEKLTGYSFVDD